MAHTHNPPNPLFNLGSFLRRGETGPAGQQLFLKGGRQADVFYRDRWAFDKVVRSTHGVNCTGSCSWKVYVKDGVITWESQAVDYPTTGSEMPDYEPRGCPRGASFSWYTYSPTRIRSPYARGVLVDMYREAKKEHGDPVLAWRSIVEDPDKRRAYVKERGKGGLIRIPYGAAKAGSFASPTRKPLRLLPPRMSTPSVSTAPTASLASPSFRPCRRSPMARERVFWSSLAA